jgi:hypothetical protein
MEVIKRHTKRVPASPVFALPVSFLPEILLQAHCCTCCAKTTHISQQKQRISRKHLSGQLKKLRLIEFLVRVKLQNCTSPKDRAAGYVRAAEFASEE